MNIDGWRYYNHAAVPTCAPHEEPDLLPIKNGSIWKMDGHPLFAAWTEDYDCGYETGWWYIIRERPFDIKNLSHSSRKSIRKSLENVDIKKINPIEYTEDLWRVYLEATEKYENYNSNITRENFINKIRDVKNRDYWAGFEKESGRMIGYKICDVMDDYVSFAVSKYSYNYLRLRVSDALNYYTLDYYLNVCNKRYVANGMRSVVHVTNVQSYYQEHFKFRKAYCKLLICHRPGYKLIVKCLQFISPFLIKQDNIEIIHKINGFLQMEKIGLFYK